MKISHIMLLVGLSGSAASALAQELSSNVRTVAHSSDWWWPDYLPVHTGNYTGMLSGGVGYKLTRSIESELLYGHVPRSVGGVELDLLSWKNYVNLFKYIAGTEWESAIYLGIGLVYGHHNNLFPVLPDKYPSGYYPPSALRYLFFSGLKLRQSHHHEFLIEYSWFDSQFERYYEDRVYQNLFTIGTYGIGYRYWI